VTAERAAKAVAKLSRLPPLAIAHKVARLVPFRPLDAERLRFLRFDGVPGVPPAMLRGRARVRRATEADVRDLAVVQDKPALFVRRFAAGDHCVVALVEERIVGYEWFCDAPVHHEAEWAYPIAIPAGFVYAYDAYVDPAFRNTGVWLHFKAHIGDWMRAHGKRGVITFVEDGNVSSWRTHLRFGFQPAETVLAVRCFGLTFFRVQPSASLSTNAVAS
jgi:GNAT superfamily N-acetyltransferase